MDENHSEKKQRHRSPAYPSVNLREAIERLYVFWDKFTKHSVHRETALQEWGYKSTTGPSARLIAALKQFDLIGEDDGKISITETGMDIVTLDESNQRHKDAIAHALKSPNIYAVLLDTYTEKLPAPSLIRSDLVRNYGFNPKSVDGFVEDFIESVHFAAGIVESEQRSDEIAQSRKRIDTGQETEQETKEIKKTILDISNEYELPNAKLVLKLETKDLLTDEDLELVEYYLQGFQRVIHAKLRQQTKVGFTHSGETASD